MMLVLKPLGRGNWASITMQVDGARAAPLLIRVGDRMVLGGVTFRIAGVRP